MPQLGDRAPITCPDTPLMLIGRDPGADGGYGRPAPEAPLPRDPNDARLWLPGQGQANSCGTTTLAYILRYLLGEGAPASAEIDRHLRRGNIFSAPLLLVSYVRDRGLAARGYDGADLDLVFGLVDRGVPVMVLTDTTPLNLADTANLHWVAVVAHCEDRVGIYNPHGFQEELSLDSFRDHWRQARIFGLPAWRNFAIAVARHPAELPATGRPGLSLIGANMAADGVANVVNDFLGVRGRLRGQDAFGSRLGIPVDAAGVVLGAALTGVGSAMLVASAAAERLVRRLGRGPSARSGA